MSILKTSTEILFFITNKRKNFAAILVTQTKVLLLRHTENTFVKKHGRANRVKAEYLCSRI